MTIRSSRGRRLSAVSLAFAMAVTLVAGPAGQAEAQPSTDITTVKVSSVSGKRTADKSDRVERTVETSSGSRRTLVLDRVVGEASDSSTPRFSTVGMTWSEDSTGTAPAVEVRTKQVDGGWTDWTTISEPEPVQGGNGRLATEPIYVGEATGVQVRAVGDGSTRLNDPELVLLGSPEMSTDSNPETYAATAAGDLAPRPPIVSRGRWGANESWRCDERKMGDTVRAVTVHHTAGSNSYSASESASIVREIYAYHTQTLGWCDIGYNFLVDRYGTIFEGRWGGVNFPVHGAHAADWNTDTSGISFMGNFEDAQPPAGMLAAGAKLIAWKLDAFQRSATGTVTLAGKKVNIIFGHGDVMATACPGRYIRSKMDDLRQDVKEIMGARSPIYDAWQSWGNDFGQPYAGEVPWDGGRKLTVLRYTGDLRDVYWHPTHGAHFVRGAIRVKYRSMGDTNSILGWPVSNTVIGPFGPETRVSRFESGSLIWSRGGGAQPMYGIFDRSYWNLGENMAALGVPLGERRRSDKDSEVRWQVFSNGRMFWRSGSGSQAFEIHGKIWKRYMRLGAVGSPLGVQTTNTYEVPRGEAVDFEHGRIFLNTSTGRTTLTYF